MILVSFMEKQIVWLFLRIKLQIKQSERQQLLHNNAWNIQRQDKEYWIDHKVYRIRATFARTEQQAIQNSKLKNSEYKSCHWIMDKP